jgi:predicted amidohydrolase
MERSTDPELIALLGDPSRPGEGVFVAIGPEVLNSSLLFAPSGELAGRVDKVFLTDPEEASLDLENGSLAASLVMETPFAKIGVAISRDAWYPPFMRRTEDLGAELVVQPEAFAGGWTIGAPDEWLPDVFLSSGWLHLQKHRFRYSVAPQLTGNFFEIPFDGQVHVAKKAAPDDAMISYVGQEPMPGFVAIGPWAGDDPQGELSSRREALRSAGNGLLESGAYAEATLASDLELAASPIPFERDPARSESRAIAASGADQRDPDLTAFGGGALLVFAEGATVRAAHHRAGVWSAAETIGDGARPAACARGSDALVVWQQGAPGSESIAWARLDESGVIERGELAGGPQWEPDCAVLEDEMLVVFEDLSRGFPRLMWARSDRAATSFAIEGEVDPSSAGERRVEGSQSEPSLSSEGDLVWIDYRDRSWDVYYARYAGGTFGASARIDGVTTEHERLHSDPRVVRDGAEIVVAFAALSDRRPHPDIRIARSLDGAAWSHEMVPGGAHERSAGLLGGGGRPRFAPDLAVGGALRLVFQDLSPDKSAVFGFAGEVERIDDTGASAVSLARPRIAASGGGFVVVWEDDRDGARQIYGTSLVE